MVCTLKQPLQSMCAVILCAFALSAQAAIVRYGVNLLPGNEAPPVTNAPDASGSGFLLLDDQSQDFTWNIEFSGLTSPVGGSGPTAHVHYAPTGQNGPFVFALDGQPGSIIDGVGEVEGIFLGTRKLGPSEIVNLESGLWYVNLHTTINNAGEIRGQILRANVSIVPIPAAAWLLIPACGILVGFAHWGRGAAPLP